MSKLGRVAQKIFASSSGAGEIGKFGSLAAGTPQVTTDPLVVQSLSNFVGGWYSAIVGNNSPAIQDMNALFFLIFYQFAYIFENGVPEWNTDTTYFMGSMVQSSGVIYISITDTNLGNPLTDPSNWRLGSKSTIITGSSNKTLTSLSDVEEFDTTAGDLTVALPVPSVSLKGKKITIVKIDSSTNVVFIAGSALSVQLEAQYDVVTMLCNGSVWYSL